MKDIEEKVMTQEEKAKRFDEVLAMAKECITYVPDNAVNQYLLDMFPELKESEDEKIRKVLVDFFKSYKEQGTCGAETFNGISTSNILAWLEKQGGKEYPQVHEIKDGENKHICELNNSYSCVKFPFKAKVKSSGKIVTIPGGQLSPDGREWRKYQSDAEDGYKVYEPNNLELVCEIKQKPAVWSEEDEKIALSIEQVMNCASFLNIVPEKIDKIRTWLKSIKDRVGCEVNCTTTKDWSEEGQKVDNNVEPKFRVGNWIVNNDSGRIYQIKSIKNYEYCLWPLDSNIEGFLRIANVDNDFHLWDITKDAKKGDVLVHNGCTFIFMGIENGIVQAFEENLLYGNKTCNFGEPDKDNDYSPASKERQDLLCQNMKEAGYEFDFDKEELKKIEQKFNIGDEIKTANEEPLTITKIDEKGYWSEDLFICGFDDTAKWEVVGQKPAWSEEDEKRAERLLGWLDTLVNYIHHDVTVSLDLRRERMQQVEQLKTWLKFLRERVQPQNTWKPSEHELEVLKLVAEKDGTCLMGLYEQLKKLRRNSYGTFNDA